MRALSIYLNPAVPVLWVLTCSATLLALTTPASADPLAELASFSQLRDVNLEKLASGAPKTSRGVAMSSPRGLAVESCYVVRKPLARAVDLHVQWTPSKHPELKVFLHGDLPAKPSVADFARLESAPKNASTKAFASASLKAAAGEVQLSRAEVATLPSDGDGSTISAPLARAWAAILAGRAQAFLAGGLSRLPAYETTKETVRPADEAAQLLKDAGKIRGQFSNLLESTPLAGGKGGTSHPYWELLDVDGQAAVTLGALYSKSSATGHQAVDVQFYSSSGFYLLVTLYQMWPVTVGGQEATLVWRGDLISAASLANLHGVERMGSSTAMMRATQKSIAAFLSDAK